MPVPTELTTAPVSTSAAPRNLRPGHMKGWYVDNVHERATHSCRHCCHPLAWVDEVGWVDLAPGNDYDMCEADPYGNHLPEPSAPTPPLPAVAR